MALTIKPSAPKSVESLPDYSHKSQELNLLDDSEAKKDNQLIGPSRGDIIPICGASSNYPTESSVAYDTENLQQYDAERRSLLIIFWSAVLVSVVIIVLIVLSTLELYHEDDDTPLQNNNETASHNIRLTKDFYTFHIMCMMVAMVFFSSFGVLLYRLLPETPMWILKWIHLGIYTAVFIAMIVGLVEIILAHSSMLTHQDTDTDKDDVHFRTLHSWCGLVLCAVFIVEFSSGLIFIISPSTYKNPQTLLQEFHRVTGSTLQVIACATAVTGVTEVANHFLLVCGQSQSSNSNCSLQTMLTKVYGLLTVIFFVLFFILVLFERFKRKARPQWKCIFSNPHHLYESSKTMVSKTSLFKLKQTRRQRRHENDDDDLDHMEESSATAAAAVAVTGAASVTALAVVPTLVLVLPRTKSNPSLT